MHKILAYTGVRLRGSTGLSLIKGESAFTVAQKAAAKATRDGADSVLASHLGGVNLHRSRLHQEGHLLFSDRTGYIPAGGTEQTRAVVAKYCGDVFGIPIDPKDVVVCAGKTMIFSTLLSLVDDGDKVYVPEPGYPIYESVVSAKQGERKPYQIKFDPSGTLESDLSELRASLSTHNAQKDGNKLVILNDPHNPTGAQFSHEQVKELEEIASENTDAMFFFDAAYLRIVYEDADSPIKAFIQNRWEEGRLAIWYTFSKEAAIPGRRMGAMLCPSSSKLIVQRQPTEKGAQEPLSLAAAVSKIIGNDGSCPNAAEDAALGFMLGDAGSQKAARESFKSQPDGERRQALVTELLSLDPTLFQSDSYEAALEHNVKELESRRDLLCDLLSECPGLTVFKPGAGFYVTAMLSEEFLTALGGDINVAGDRILEEIGIAVCNNTHFSNDRADGTGFVRLAFSAITKEQIKQFIPRLTALYHELVPQIK